MSGEFPPAVGAEKILEQPDVIAAHYAAAAEMAGITVVEGVNLGQMLSLLRRNHEHVFRARFGMYPYDHAHSIEEIAAHHDTKPQQVEHTLASAVATLTSEQMRKILADTERHFTLEELAINLQNTHDIKPLDVEIVKELYGLPPYYLPRSGYALAADHHRVPNAIRARRDLVLKKVLPGWQNPASKPVQVVQAHRQWIRPDDAEQQTLFDDRDAGF